MRAPAGRTGAASPAGRTGPSRPRAPRALAPAALAFAGYALLTACGVPPTGVVEVGSPATGLHLTQGVYFLVRGEGDALRAVPRAETSARGALRALLRGPTSPERTVLTTALPKHLALPRVTATATTLDLRFPRGTRPLPARASRQLACTVLLNTPAGGTPTALPRATDVPERGSALATARVTTARVSVPGAPAALTDRAECPGLVD
jgi:hypothetical protein